MDKDQIKKLRDTLIKKSVPVFDRLDTERSNEVFPFCERYKNFLNTAKTEREATREIVRMAEEKGFVNIDTMLNKKAAGSCPKVFKIFQGKCVALAVPGKHNPCEGMNIIVSHIDSPRLDLKQNPVYEDSHMVLLKTHYYGGIRKYHWLAMPLALHGSIVKSNGEILDICIGEARDDPVFTITDLLPHLAGKIQNKKTIAEVFEGEKLNLIAGSTPLGGEEEKDRFKLNLLHLLNEKYGLIEEDFISAEIEAVPSEKAKDVGFDRSMIGAYGQDDRICAFTSLESILSLESPERTAVALFFDKEEIGSEGNSGAKSNFIEDFISDLLVINAHDADSRLLRKALINSSCLSADVNAAMDPDFKEVYEPMNAAKLGFGPCMTKFTGSAGKSGASDAGAEFVGRIRQIFNQHGIVWQTGELGKVDHGGGGTVAMFLAKYGMNVLDCGPALLSMHSPFEISHKADVYMTYLGYKVFYSH